MKMLKHHARRLWTGVKKHAGRAIAVGTIALGTVLTAPQANAQLTDSSYVADVTGVFDQFAHDKNALIGPGVAIVFIGIAVLALVAFGKRFVRP